MTEENDGFLSRWSRRKQQARADEDTRPTPPDVESEDAPSPPATGGIADAPDAPVPATDSPENESESEALRRLGLPDPDTLGMGDDFSGFMQAGVPEVLRRRALRRLWRSNPTLAVLDGLNDYDDDFTGGFVPPGTLKTLYKVGKGFVAAEPPDVQDTASPVPDDRDIVTRLGADPAAEPLGQAISPDEDEDPKAPAGGQEETKEIMVVPPMVEDEQFDEAEPEPRATRRRMTFHVPET